MTITMKDWDEVIDRRAQYLSAAPCSPHSVGEARSIFKEFF